MITYESLKVKIDSLLEGFYSVIYPKIPKIFTVEEFDFILSGQQSLEIKDWRNNTVYKGHFNPEHKVRFYKFKVNKRLLGYFKQLRE